MPSLMVERSLEVEASADAVWAAMVDVKSWPQWKPFVTKAGIAGYEALSNGARIRMSLLIGGPAAAPLRVTVTEFDRPQRLAWEGGVKGLLQAVHSFEFKDLGKTTRVTTREEFSGALLGLMQLMVTKEDLEELHEKWLAAIKSKVEDKPPVESAAGHGSH